MNGAFVKGKKTEEYEAFFEKYEGDMALVRRILGRKTLVHVPIGSVYESISGTNSTKITGRRFKLEDLPPSAQKRIEETAANGARATVKSLQKEILSLKDALNMQKEAHEKVMNARVSSLVRQHEREMALVKEEHERERERMESNRTWNLPTKKSCDRRISSVCWKPSWIT